MAGYGMGGFAIGHGVGAAGRGLGLAPVPGAGGRGLGLAPGPGAGGRGLGLGPGLGAGGRGLGLGPGPGAAFGVGGGLGVGVGAGAGRGAAVGVGRGAGPAAFSELPPDVPKAFLPGEEEETAPLLCARHFKLWKDAREWLGKLQQSYFANENALYARIDMDPCIMQEWMRLDIESKISHLS